MASIASSMAKAPPIRRHLPWQYHESHSVPHSIDLSGGEVLAHTESLPT